MWRLAERLRTLVDLFIINVQFIPPQGTLVIIVVSVFFFVFFFGFVFKFRRGHYFEHGNLRIPILALFWQFINSNICCFILGFIIPKLHYSEGSLIWKLKMHLPEIWYIIWYVLIRTSKIRSCFSQPLPWIWIHILI